MEITTANLGSINNGLNVSFNSQLYRAASVYKQFTYAASSTGTDEVYPALDQIRGPREWLGAREAQKLSMHSFTIKNRKFEQTIEVTREDIEDDKYGLYQPVASEIGLSAAEFPELLIAQLLQSGTTTAAYDLANFFDAEHPGYTAAGSASGAPNTTLPNYFPGSAGNIGPGWYMIDNSRALKPFIFQTRIPFSLTTRFNPEDPTVFDNDKFLWGTRGRMNAGFGVWQLAAYSTLPMTQANMIAVRTAMAALRRPDGTPMGITMDTVIVPSTLYPQANSYFVNGLVGSSPSAPTTLVENQIKGWFKPIEFKWLN